MVIINPPLAIYKHLAALSFMLAGVFADLLVVRLCLSSAYIFLILNGIMGSPLWPHLRRPGHLTVDMLIWGFICLYVHVASVVRLLLDEQHVELTEHEEALWRLFYRVGGLSRKLFKHHIATHMQVTHHVKGDNISVDDYFYITYQGSVEIEVRDKRKDIVIHTDCDGSGSMFDLKSLGLLHMHTPFRNHVLKVTAMSDCIFFRFSNQDIRNIANTNLTKGVWQTVFIGILARLAIQRMPSHQGEDFNQSTDIDPLFGPLSESEKPDPVLAGSGAALERPLTHVWYCMQRFFTPPWPFGRHLIGVRHNMLSAPVPTEGATETLEKGFDDNLHNNGDENDSQALLKKDDNVPKYNSIV